MKYDGGVAGIGVSAGNGKGGRYGAQWADRGGGGS
jgi:hypothetical protein